MSVVRRRVVAVLMMAGLLVQALAVVRHASMLMTISLSASMAADVQHQIRPEDRTLAADLLTAICHPDGTSAMPTGTDTPVKSDMSGCPICNGLVTAFALAPSLAQVGTIARPDKVIAFAPFDQRVSRHAFLRPQSRGPPALG